MKRIRSSRRAAAPGRLRGLLMAATLAVPALLAVAAPPAVSVISGGRYGEVKISEPAGPMRSFVILFSGAQGWRATDQHTAERLAGAGALVVGVDTAHYAAVLAATPESCHSLVGDAENISHQLQRERHSSGYFSPVLAGAGQGGTLAAHALAEAPSNTLAGGLAVAPDATLDPRFAPCPPDTTLSRGSGLPGFYGIAMADGETAARSDGKTGAALPAGAALRRFAAGTTPADMLLALIEPHLGRANPGEDVSAGGALEKNGGLADLPLIELPAAHPNGLMAVVVSGDGGWRDLDKTIAETLQKKGVSVIGWDSLRYFWRAKTPQETSHDLARILDAYGARWHVRQVALIGYSFGADVLPFAYNRLPPTLRERVSAMALLGFAPSADFQIRVTGWLGLPASDSALPVAAEIARVPPTLIQCFYGEHETDTACPLLAGTPAKVIRTSGGHHFDHDYGQLAADILDHWRRPGGALPSEMQRGRAPPSL